MQKLPAIRMVEIYFSVGCCRSSWPLCSMRHKRSGFAIINTPHSGSEANDDSYLRKAAIKKKVSYITTIAAAKAAASGIKSMNRPGCGVIKSLQELHAEIKEK